MRRDEELAVVLAALRFACKLSTDISCKINQELDSRSTPVPTPVHDPPTPKSNSNSGHGHMDNFDACRDSRTSSVGHGQGTRDDRKSNDNGSLAVLAAPAGATCYSVIVAFAGLERIFPAERAECREAIAEKFESLRLFWRVYPFTPASQSYLRSSFNLVGPIFDLTRNPPPPMFRL